VLAGRKALHNPINPDSQLLAAEQLVVLLDSGLPYFHLCLSTYSALSRLLLSFKRPTRHNPTATVADYWGGATPNASSPRVISHMS